MVGDNQLPLFEGVQPWEVKSPGDLPDVALIERRALLAAVAESRLGRMEQRVAYILQQYPETRDSDTALGIRYWRRFQPNVLEEWDRLDLDVLYDLDRIETISRIRRHIQNDLRLFTSSAHTRERRDEMQMELYQYLAAQRHTESEIRFYLDETCGDGKSNYIGVAGVCVINWRQYEKHWASLTEWREQQGWPETIHFADTGTALQPRAMALLSEMHKRRAGLLFLGYALPARGNTHQTMLSLFVQLVGDALLHLDALGCIAEPRALFVVKEASVGFDTIHLQSLKTHLAEKIASDFPERVFLRDVEPLPKGREVLLECADVIAGGMQRRALYGGNNPKDVLAESVFNVTGFEDPRENGTVFKAHLS